MQNIRVQYELYRGFMDLKEQRQLHYELACQKKKKKERKEKKLRKEIKRLREW
jgi:hypothetical protein